MGSSMSDSAPNAVSRLLAEAFSGSWPRRVAYGLLLAYVVAAPFPWGSVQPGLTGTGKIVLGAFLVTLVTFLAPDARPHLHGIRLPLAAVAGLGLLGLLQLLPLPAGLVALVSPASAEAWAGAGRVFASFGEPAPAARVSLAPWETAGTALLALAFVGLFLSASVLLARRAPRRLFGLVVLASGVFQVARALATEDRLLRLHGSFVNPNNLAGYLEISLACAFGFLWYRARSAVRDFAAISGIDERADWLVRLVPRFFLSFLLWAFLAAGVVVTQSRGGLLAAAGTTVLLGALAWEARTVAPQGGRHVVASVLGVLVVAGTAFAIAGAGTVAFLRFVLPDSADLAADYRVLVWRDSLEAFGLFPALGSGLGTFREAIRRVQSPEVRGLVEQAHNEYLQILVTGGVAGAALALTAIVAGARALLRGFFHQRHREEAAWGLAGIGALAMLLLHGMAEFNFSIPAIPATLAACLGCAWAALRWKRADEPGLDLVPSPTTAGGEPRRHRRHRSRPEPESA